MEMWVKVLHSICNMGTCGLPDMYTLGPAVLVPQGARIRQTTRAHVTNTKYTTPAKRKSAPSMRIIANMLKVLHDILAIFLSNLKNE